MDNLDYSRRTITRSSFQRISSTLSDKLGMLITEKKSLSPDMLKSYDYAKSLILKNKSCLNLKRKENSHIKEKKILSYKLEAAKLITDRILNFIKKKFWKKFIDLKDRNQKNYGKKITRTCSEI